MSIKEFSLLVFRKYELLHLHRIAIIKWFHNYLILNGLWKCYRNTSHWYTYQFIMVVFMLLFIITFSNQDDVLFGIAVSTSIMYGPICWIVVLSSYTLFPDSQNPTTILYEFSCTLVFLSTSRIYGSICWTTN